MTIRKIFTIIFLLCILGGCKTTEIVHQPEISVPAKTKHFKIVEEDDPYPSVGSILNETGRLIGSGILIESNIVLTAGHVADSPRRAFSFFIGEEEILIDYVILHPKYNLNKKVSNDVALVFLACDSIYPPAQLQEPNDILFQGAILTTVGYGGGEKRYSLPNTFWYYGVLIDQPSQIKWLPISATIWFGDSGGAVFCSFGGERKVVGIISSLSFCADGPYENSATSVQYFYDWIMEVINGKGRESIIIVK